ncbi:MAG: LptF/LptG family permease [Oligoflexia bacterium]|nr:LptF/LptG family permease [Oligoflexia bacterium]
MYTLKRLITVNWIKAFCGSCAVFLLLVAVANIVSEFLRAATTVQDILLHFLLELPKWLNKIFPVAGLTATLFSLDKLQRRSELISIFACGLPRYIFISLLLQLALAVAAIQFYCAAYLRPYAESLMKEWLRDGGIHFRQSDKVSGIKATTSASGKIWYKNGTYFCSFAAFDKFKNQLLDISLFYYSQEYRLSQIIWAKSATYQENFRWKLFAGRELSGLQNKNFPTVNFFPEKSINLLEKAVDFKDIDSEINELNFPKLYQYVQRIKRLGIDVAEYETLFYDKISSALICILFPFIAIGALYNPNRRSGSFGKNVFFVLIFTSVFWLAYSSALALGSGRKIHPLLATFAIPVVCMLYLLFYFIKNRKLS